MATQTAETPISNGQGVEAKQSRFFQLSLDMCLIVGFDGYLKQLNPMCEKTLLFTTEEFLSQPLLDLIHPEDRELTLVQFEKLSTSTDTVSFESRCRCQDGSYKWLLWNATPCHEEQLIYATARDITESKQSKEALQAREEGYRLLIESVKDYAIYMLDPNGYIISWNSGAERLKGYRADEIIGQHFSCFYLSQDVQNRKPEQELKIAASEGRYEDEGCRVRKDGSKFWVNAVVTALRDSNGQLRGFAKVTRDITERKRSQEALQQAHDDLERRVEERTAELQAANVLLKQEINERKRTETALRQSKAHLKEQAKQLEQALYELQRTQAQLIQTEKMSSLGQLVAGVAHEINNPVSFIYCNIDHASRYIRDLLHLLNLYQTYYPHPPAAIQNTAEVIDLDFLLADMPKLLSSIKLGAERIGQIVASLRNFSRHDEAEMKFVDIHEGIDNTLKLMQNRLKGDGAGIQVIQAYGELPLVECYPGLLNQVFMNILNNAIDALETHPDPRIITICTLVGTSNLRLATGEFSNPKTHILIRISDNGPGITEEIGSRLFDPFFTTKPVGKGVGLGLSTSYHIVVEKHGGRITCVSEPGQGAEFIIEIPVSQHSRNCVLLQPPSEVFTNQQLAFG